MSDRAALVRFFEASIPFNAHLGMQFDPDAVDPVVVRIPFAPHLVGDPIRPALHGGVISTLADTAGGFAVYCALGDPAARVATVDLRVDYLAPGALTELVAEASVVRLGGRIAVARITLRQGGPPIADATGVYHLRAGARRAT